jgi:ABC-type cobalamin/Fe3+-siderophores transport system ATPase subunit
MRITITLRGYRTFLAPSSITLGDGNVALIGPNNSGKSNVFRAIYEFRSIFRAALDWIENGSSMPAMSPTGLAEPLEYFPRSIDMQFSMEVSLDDQLAHGEACALEISADKSSPTSFLVRARTQDGLWMDRNDVSLARHEANLTFNSLRATVSYLERSKYYGASRASVALFGAGTHFDLSAGSGLVSLWDAWRRESGLADDEKARRITQVLSELFGFEDLHINANRNSNDLFFEFGGRRHKMSEMGFGVSQLFSLLVNAASARPTIIFVDEPESNIHAALQLRFFSALSEFSDSIVFSTHSIGLARQVSNRIYSFRRSKSGTDVRLFEDPRFMSSQLGELSLSAHREIGFSRVLLVEGPTDVQVFQVVLQTLGLGGQVVLLNLGGSSNIGPHARPQLQELMRLVDFDEVDPALGVIIDSERGSRGEKSTQLFKSIVDDLRVPICVLERRSIESYFSDELADTPEVRAGTKPDESQRKPGRNKTMNFKAAAQWTREQILDTDFGRFLSTWASASPKQ